MQSWRRTIYILFFAQLVSSMGFNVFLPFLSIYVNKLGTQTALDPEFWVGIVFSAPAVTMIFAAPFWGSIADRYGRKLMLERSMFGGTIVFFLMSFATNAEQLALLRALQGAITGIVSAASALAASVTPRERSGFALGTLQVGRFAGLAIGPLVGGTVADIFGYQATFIVTALLLGVAGILVFLGVHEDFHPPVREKKVGHKPLQKWRNILAMPGVKVAYMLDFSGWFARLTVVPFLPLFVVMLSPAGSASNTVVGLLSSITAVSAMIGAFFLGRLGDRIGHRTILIGSALMTACFYLPQTFAVAIWQLALLQFFAGIAMGGLLPALGSLLKQYTQHGDEGAVYGLENSVVSSAQMIAPQLASLIVALFGLRSVFLFAAGCYLATSLLALYMLPGSPFLKKGKPALPKTPYVEHA